MKVFVLNKQGQPLMPTTPRKARLLLKQGKAKVAGREPFTIQLVHGPSGYKQPVVKGMCSYGKQVALYVKHSKPWYVSTSKVVSLRKRRGLCAVI